MKLTPGGVLPTVIGRGDYAEDFVKGYECWKSSVASLSVQCFAIKKEEGWILSKAQIFLGPVKFNTEEEELIKTKSVFAANVQKNIHGHELDNFILDFLKGAFRICDEVLRFPNLKDVSFYSRRNDYEAIVFDKVLEIRSTSRKVSLYDDVPLYQINNELRANQIPYDGLSDLLRHLNFKDTRYTTDCEAELTMFAPLAVSKCEIEASGVTLNFVSHTDLLVEEISVGLVVRNDKQALKRVNITDQIQWEKNGDNLIGLVVLKWECITAVQVLLNFAGESVLRSVFINEKNRPNPRLSKYLAFDPDLRQLKSAIGSRSRDSDSLEKALAVLAWLYGFSPSPIMETDAPDLVIESQAGGIVLVEATTSVRDIRAKAGKLVDRRFHLIDRLALEPFNHRVLAVLAVNLPKEQIANDMEYFVKNKVLLLTGEDLNGALEDLNFPKKPDEIIDEAIKKLREPVKVS